MLNRLEEKRQFQRLRLKEPLRYQIRGGQAFDNSITDDISLGGVCFTSDTFIKPDSLVSLEIKLLSKVLRPVGKVAWVNNLSFSGKFRLGVEFLQLDEPEKDYLFDYINMRLEK